MTETYTALAVNLEHTDDQLQRLVNVPIHLDHE